MAAKHKRAYFTAFEYAEGDWVPCLRCSASGHDIHHLTGRGMGKDEIWNLVCLCRSCHNLIHNKAEGPEINEAMKARHAVELRIRGMHEQAKKILQEMR